MDGPNWICYSHSSSCRLWMVSLECLFRCVAMRFSLTHTHTHLVAIWSWIRVAIHSITTTTKITTTHTIENTTTTICRLTNNNAVERFHRRFSYHIVAPLTDWKKTPTQTQIHSGREGECVCVCVSVRVYDKMAPASCACAHCCQSSTVANLALLPGRLCRSVLSPADVCLALHHYRPKA